MVVISKLKCAGYLIFLLSLWYFFPRCMHVERNAALVSDSRGPAQSPSLFNGWAYYFISCAKSPTYKGV